MDKSCKNCGLNEYEIIDGHYYCQECHEEYENFVDKEVDNYENENIIYDTRGATKKVDVKKEEKKRQEAIESKCTSFEEYNYILRGLVDEILILEDIPNFKQTVLQLWIYYLKKTEVAFFDSDNIAHLPKLHAKFRPEDAQILYNKQPVKRKRKYKPKPKVEVKLEDDSRATRSLKKRRSRRSLKKIQKMNEESESSFVSSNTSTLTNLTVEDIEASMIAQELKIEFSNLGKRTRDNYEKYMKARGIDVSLEDDEKMALKGTNYHNYRDNACVLSGKTILFIIYCALNFCGSTIQFSDLLRLAREGHISFWNFRKFLPEKLEGRKLSLEKYHSTYNVGHSTMVYYLNYFLDNFPALKASLQMPNLAVLARRYIEDMNLPTSLGDYVEKLIGLMPSKLKYVTHTMPNYEARAMAYILFTMKLLFGIDGFREKEISASADVINVELEKQEIPYKLFSYEAWRESIEYRDVLLDKYYCPSIFNDNNNNERPYESYISIINQVQPQNFHALQSDGKLNKSKLADIHKKTVTKELVQKLLNLHMDEDPAKDLKFSYSPTPLKNALRVILESPLEATINKSILKDFSDHTLEFYFKPEKLVEVFAEQNINLATKPSTFPKNYSFQKRSIYTFNPSTNSNKIEISHETVDAATWKANAKKHEKEKAKNKEHEKVQLHYRNKARVLKERLALRKLIALKRKSDLDDLEFDEIVETPKNDQVNDNQLTFVHPDFNYWYRNLQMHRQIYNNFTEDMNKLPKSFLWLIKLASKVINQDFNFIYFNLNLLENNFINDYHPLELTDNSLEVKANSAQNKYW